MSRIQTFLKELSHEVETTRKMLSRVPNDKYDWKPHEKSMDIRRLTAHIADLPGWVNMALTSDELDFANSDWKEEKIENTTQLVDYLNRSYEKGKTALENAKEETLDENWTLRSGSEIYDVSPKAEVIRMSLNQIVHHRAQLGVYLRLLNVPIPGSYGPSADEMSF
jgi:uncharacterized damage-inducible protein DinB